ncbi:MAG: carboxypeptidase M32 [Planctomycetota bacterium]
MTSMTTAPHGDATTADYEALCALARETGTLASVSRLLGWDQETYMPLGAAAARAEQSAAMASIVHERSTSAAFGDLLAACEADDALTSDSEGRTARNLREMRRDYDRAVRLPGELVRELARVGSLAQDAWKHARESSDFASFLPHLETMLDLTRRKAECWGAPEGGELYDALLDDYEPGARAAEVEAVFTPLASRLSALIAELRDKGTPPDTAVLSTRIPAEAQHAFGLEVIAALGFDLNTGRLDTTTHPFCEGLAPGDTRLTTRYRDERFTDALYGTMHEAGHGLYEQGLDKATLFGTPLSEAISLGIHESQSRMLENLVGRSEAFWTWALPIANKHFADALQGQTPESMYRAVNTAIPSYIRVEADEATYNLHVLLRFEIERALVRGDLAPKDLPGVWNSRFKELFGLDVPDDRRGCLQDVHWSFGLIGYFPTYTLGNLYSAQFWQTINEQIPDLDTRMASGDFGTLRTWLKEHVHAPGKRYRAGELCERITGKPLSHEPLLVYLEGKLKPIYGV